MSRLEFEYGAEMRPIAFLLEDWQVSTRNVQKIKLMLAENAVEKLPLELRAKGEALLSPLRAVINANKNNVIYLANYR